MPLDTTPAVDWAALEAERDVYLLRHKRTAKGLDEALAEIKRRERMAESLASRPAADHFLLAEYKRLEPIT